MAVFARHFGAVAAVALALAASTEAVSLRHEVAESLEPGSQLEPNSYGKGSLLAELANCETRFVKVGDGYCRNSEDLLDQGSNSELYGGVKTSGECESICLETAGCKGIEYDERPHRMSCEVHMDAIETIKPKEMVTCYKLVSECDNDSPEQGSGGVLMLHQSDFDAGTVFLDQDGATYKLAENIVFRPPGMLTPEAPEFWMFPDTSKPPYNAPSFRLGYFTAVSIIADGVTLDLNGFKIEQSQEHALVQRFFSIIELNSSPFPPNIGPAHFGGPKTFKAASNVTIKNGYLGRSSHHGLHGNSNEHVVLKNLVIEDFEVAGVALNGITFLDMDEVKVRNSRADVPVTPVLSQSVFLLQAVAKFLSAPADSEVMAKAAALRSAIYEYFTSRKDPYGIFASRTDGVPDGSLLAGIMLHARINVNNFEHKLLGGDLGNGGASDLRLKNVQISNLTAGPVEVGRLLPLADGAAAFAAVVDMVGGSFFIDQVVDFNGDFKYKPNPFADLQLAVAQYAIDCQSAHKPCGEGAEGSLLVRQAIPQMVVDWSKSSNPKAAWVNIKEHYTVQTGRDAMGHFAKGVVGLKLDGVTQVEIKDVLVSGVVNTARFENRSPLAFKQDPDYLFKGFAVRGVSIASSVEVYGEDVSIHGISAGSGPEICVDTLNMVYGIHLDLEGTCT